MSRENDRLAQKEKELRDAIRAQEQSKDPFKSHDSMDIDPYTGVVETTGYGYCDEVSEDVREDFRDDLEDDLQINQEKREENELCR